MLPNAHERTLLIHPELQAGTLPVDALATANALLDDLYDGADQPLAFLPQERHVGPCRVCGIVQPLTFEHVPPAASGNNVRARGASMWDMATSQTPLEFPTRGWWPSQRGVGGYVLCGDCNNTIGGQYVPEYVAFTNTVRDRLFATLRERTKTNRPVPGIVDLALGDWALGDIARAALTSLMAVSISDRLLKLFPVLTEVVLLGAAPLPAELQLRLALSVGSRVRVNAPIAAGTADGCSVFIEVAIAPFAWVLAFVQDGLRPLKGTTDVSNWLAIGPKQQAAEARATIPIASLSSPFPGDYRPRDLITHEC